MLRGSQAQQLTGKRKGKVQEDETPKVSGVERLPTELVPCIMFPAFVYLMETHVFGVVWGIITIFLVWHSNTSLTGHIYKAKKRSVNT